MAGERASAFLAWRAVRSGSPHSGKTSWGLSPVNGGRAPGARCVRFPGNAVDSQRGDETALGTFLSCHYKGGKHMRRLETRRPQSQAGNRVHIRDPLRGIVPASQPTAFRLGGNRHTINLASLHVHCILHRRGPEEAI